MQKIRTIKKAYEELHRADPNCGISQSFIRQLISDGRCPCVMVGNRALLDMEILEDVLKREIRSEDR